MMKKEERRLRLAADSIIGGALCLIVVVVGFAFGWHAPRVIERTTYAAALEEKPVIGPTIWLSSVSALNSTHAATGSGTMTSCRESAVYVVWGTGVASGAVTLESSYDPSYTGTWAPLVVVTFSGSAPKQDIVQVTGIHANLRTRISTVLAGGTVSTWLACN